MDKNHLQLVIRPVDTNTTLPLEFAGRIMAGFPSPAADYEGELIDLNKELIKHPLSTFYGQIRGDSMKDAGLEQGDIVIIDKSLRPSDGDMAVCFIDGEFTIKFIEIHPDHIMLIPANNKYDPIKVTEDNDFLIWGIVTYWIRSPKKREG